MADVQFTIQPVDESQRASFQSVIDNKIKPPGSLGQLEQLAVQIAMLQQRETLEITKPTVLMFAADHGIARHGVSIAPSQVTGMMVDNFANDLAAINCICRSNGLALQVVDAGMLEPAKSAGVIDSRIGSGTQDFSDQPAMTEEQTLLAIEKGAAQVRKLHQQGVNCVAFGEMGIGNTSSASAIIYCLTDLLLEQCVGRGTGIDEDQLARKFSLIKQGVKRFEKRDPLSVLSQVGGFEIAQLCGAILAAAELKMIAVIDGFIVSAAALLAIKLYPQSIQSMVFSHCSHESGHWYLLDKLNVEPLLNLNLRLGEGSGAALAMPLIKSAVEIYNNMASFESVGIELP